MSEENHTENYWWAASQLAARYNVTPRTLNRWIAQGIFPKADRVINGHRRWSDSTRETHERGPVQRGTKPTLPARTPTTSQAADQVAA